MSAIRAITHSPAANDAAYWFVMVVTPAVQAYFWIGYLVS